MGTARIGICVLLVLYLSMCPILPFDLSATQINQSYEIWPQDGKASEFFHSLTISLMCFFPVFNSKMMAVTMTIIIKNANAIYTNSGYMYISAYTDFCTAVKKLTLFPLYISGIKAFTASVAINIYTFHL